MDANKVNVSLANGQEFNLPSLTELATLLEYSIVAESEVISVTVDGQAGSLADWNIQADAASENGPSFTWEDVEGDVRGPLTLAELQSGSQSERLLFAESTTLREWHTKRPFLASGLEGLRTVGNQQPQEIAEPAPLGFCLPGCLLGWIWATFTLGPLWIFSACVGPFSNIYLGVEGWRLLWAKRRHKSVAEMKSTQTMWVILAVLLYLVVFVVRQSLSSPTRPAT
ncbi:MAG: hypothetical protein JSS65_07070 [Armatimonadetes bacterium]|nr:hypothetical protein [Armatimonadota bacterium]